MLVQIRNWLQISLLNFFLAALLGTLLRLAFVIEIPWINYRFILHGHSHVAMLGWVYLTLYALLIHHFLPHKRTNDRFYRRLFGVTQFSVIGMCVAFPLQGYAGWSIVFSALHILCAYAFVWRFLRDLRTLDTENNRFAFLFVRTALFLMVLSTIGVWALPVLIGLGLAGSAAYYASIQFYLHFQLNGWFTFSGLSLVFLLLERQRLPLDQRQARLFFGLLILSCFLTYALAVTWSTPLPVLFFTNSAGVVLQLSALFIFFKMIRAEGASLTAFFPAQSRNLMHFALICFAGKILIQAVVVVPQLATVAYTIRNFVLGFLHLLLLGMMTSFVLGLSIKAGLIIMKRPLAKYGLFILVIGILLTEVLLFGQGVLLWLGIGFLPRYYELIFAASLFLPLGILGLLFSQILPREKTGTDLSSSMQEISNC